MRRQPIMQRQRANCASLIVFALCAGAAMAGPAATSAANPLKPILSIDFSSAEAAAYADAQAIGTADNQMTSRITAGGCQVSITGAGGARALEFISDGSSPLSHATHGAVKLIPKGVTQLTSSVRFTILEAPQGATRGVLGVHLFSSSQYLTTGNISISGVVLSQGEMRQKKLPAGKTYRLDSTADFTDPAQHTWEYRIYEEGSDKPLFDSGELKTRNPKDAPVMFALTAAGTPYVRIHKVDIAGRVDPALSRAPEKQPAAPVEPASQPVLPPDDDSIICNHVRQKNAPLPAEVRCKNAQTAGRILLFPRGSKPQIELPVQNDRPQPIEAQYTLALLDRQGAQLRPLQSQSLVLPAGGAASVNCTLDTSDLKYGVYSLVLRVTAGGAPLTQREYYLGVVSSTNIAKAADGDFLYGLDPNYGGVIEREAMPAIPGRRALPAQQRLIEWVDAMGADILRSAGCMIGVESAFRDPSIFVTREMPILREHGIRIMGMASPVVKNPQARPALFEEQRKTLNEALESLARQLPDVIYWELGNEPDLGYPDMDTYVQVYEEMYAAVKRGNPKAQVMNGALTFFGAKGPANSRRFIEKVNPALIDVLAYHAHGPGSGAERRIYELMHQTAAEFGKADKPFADTESGMFVGSRKQEDMQAWMVVQKQTYAQSIGLKFLMTFRLHAFRSETGWGLLRSDQEPQPAILAYRAMAEHLKGLAYQKKLEMTQEHAEGYAFADGKGARRACVYWANQPAFYNVYLKVAGSAQQARNLRLMDIYGNETPAQISPDGVVHIEVSEAPQYLLWDTADPQASVTVVRSMLKTPDMVTAIPGGVSALPLTIENSSDSEIKATLSAAVAAPGAAQITPAQQSLVIPAHGSQPVQLELKWDPQRQGLAWPESWTVYTDLSDAEVPLATLREVPQSLKGVLGRVVRAQKGVISLLRAGELPREKRAGLIFGSVRSDRDQVVRIGAAADWYMQFLVNGTVICDTLEKGNNALAASERLLDLPLKKGDNLLVLKVLSGKGGWSATLASPDELPALLDPRRASNCVDLTLESGGKVLASERLALRPVQRILPMGAASWRDPLEKWQSMEPDLVLGATSVVNLFDKQPDRSKWWQDENDLSAKAWLRCDAKRLYLVCWVLDDKDLTGDKPETIRWFDCLRVALSSDGKSYDEYSIGRLAGKPTIFREFSTRGLPKGEVAAGADEIQVEASRIGKGTLYRVSLDRSALGESLLRLNLLINDNDDGYRKQYLLLTDDTGNMTKPAAWQQYILSK